MLKLFKHLKAKEWILAVVAVAFIVAQVWLDLKLPDYMSDITLLITSPNGTVSGVWKQGAFMLLCAFGSAIFSFVVGFIAAYIAANLSRRLRTLVYDKVQSFSTEEIQKFSISSLITRSTNDVTQIQTIVAMGLQVVVKAPIMAVWAILKIVNKSWQWSLATAVAVLFLLIVILTVMVIALPRFKKVQALTDNLNKVTRENLMGIRVVRAYNAEEFEQNKFDKASTDVTKNQLVTSRLMALFSPAMTLVMSGLNLAIYWIGALIINNAQIIDRFVLFSDMVVFSAYAAQVVMSFIMIVMIFIMLPRASVSGKRVNEVLNTSVTILDGHKTPDKNILGEIEFKDVCFKYPGADECVLKNLNFTIRKGQTVAFIGSTGSGKSTLINLVPRLYDVSSGEILVDGQNVKDYKLEDLHNKIGYISQKPVLFAGTIASNLLMGENGKPEPTADEVLEALEVAQSTKFVLGLPEKHVAPVNEGGTNFSGGQKQRLNIARAIIRKPEIYIFDDSFSALDYKTDKNLRKALKNYSKDATTLIVAQRIGTIKNADTIIVLNNGEIVGMGKHKQLLKNCQVYYEIASSQLSKEELENE